MRVRARRRLPPPIFDYLDGGAEDEGTLRRNTSAFDDALIEPRCLIDVDAVSTEVEVLGQKMSFPVFCSPTGASRFYHPTGELSVARAAARAGVIYGLSTMSSHSLEEVAAASGEGPRMFQLYVFRDRGVTRELIDRAKAAGYGALCLTVDAAVRGNRERELRSGVTVPIRLNAAGVRGFAMHPGWLLGQAMKGPMSLPNFAAASGSSEIVGQTHFVARQLDPSVTWRDAEEMMVHWDGPFAIKGVMTVPDARHAVDAGASAVIVSNHGGRQLDGAAAPIEALPGIAAAIGDRAEVILDGGVRRGVHVLKALALGAKACSVGRPYLYGLAAGGEAGVARALGLLRDELVCAMRLSGCTDARAVDPALIRGHAAPPARRRRA